MASGVSDKRLRSKNILTDVLLKERRPVLFVGEGDFTFTVAFATLREKYRLRAEQSVDSIASEMATLQLGDGSPVWDGIMSTRYEPVARQHGQQRIDIPCGTTVNSEGVTSTCYINLHTKCAPSLLEAKLGCVSASAVYFQEEVRRDVKAAVHRCTGTQPLPTEPCPDTESQVCTEFDAIVKAVMGLPAVQWRYGVSASYIPQDLIPPRHPCVIWFQCPWLEDRNRLGDLIQQFLLNAAPNLRKGDLMCVGIVNNASYIGAYSLDSILGREAEPNCTAVLERYDFRGADDQLVREVLKYGYRHQGARDIHRTNIPNHITLVFELVKLIPCIQQ